MPTPTPDPVVVDFLNYCGVPVSKETVDQLAVFADALKIHAERTASYGQAWKQYGAMAMLLKLAGKVDRLMARHWWTRDFHKASDDDALDVLNYGAFFIRCVKSGNMVGHPPTRSELEELESPFRNPNIQEPKV